MSRKEAWILPVSGRVDLEFDWYFAGATVDGFVTRFMHRYQGFIPFRSVEDTFTLLTGRHEVCEGYFTTLFLIFISNH